ncbi:MAG TPA: MFS transporter [Chthoniobacterales bacterium]|nr:MFS transporter [Chthoniobacterales bacterium]
MAEILKQTPPAEEHVAPGAFRGFVAKFTILGSAKRELWLTFAIKLLIYTAYSITNKTMVLWLSKDLGFSDQAAGAFVGWIWAPLMTVFTLLAGSLTDAIGLRRTFFLGVVICTFARSVMVLTKNPTFALAAGLLPLAIGEALGTPVLLAATRVYSTTAQRSISFSIIYALMNVGYLIAGYVFDFVRSLDLHLNIAGFQPTPHEQLFAISLALEIALFPTIYFLRRSEEGRSRPETQYAVAAGFWTDIGRTIKQGATDTITLFHRLVTQSAFYRLLVFFLFIGFLKAIFLQLDYVFPKFGDREMGLHAPVGKLAGINAILIIILAPIVGALTQRVASYRIVVIGSIICATGVFIMALPSDWFVPAANGALGSALGHGYLQLTGAIHPYYIMSALYLTVFSIGEAFYSPRVYEYAASIAPPGQEASYGALAYIPFLFGKLLIGTSGWLLAAFCPEHGECRPAALWLIFALAASAAPVGLLAFRRFIQVPEAGRQS